MVHDVVGWIEFVKRYRTEHPRLKIVLGPVIYLLTVVKVFLKIGADSSHKLHVYVIPQTIRNVRDHFMSATPMSIYCHGKRGLLIHLLEFYFVASYLGWVRIFRRWVPLYVVNKLVVVSLPFVLLSPLERLPFWLPAVGVSAVEAAISLWLILAWGWGIDWKNDNFYGHWKKHYRYKYASGNRQVTIELSVWVYCISKFLILNNYFCFNRALQTARLKAPHTPTKGTLSIDNDYITLLTEQDSVANLRYGILFLLALSSLGVYSIILAGWSSNSKYAFIGALRSAAQMISYEVAISLIILPVVILAGSLSLTMITYVQSITVWFVWPLLPVSILFLIAMLAETNRTPFDLPEAEAELVAGYNVDYSSLPFAMFFLGEYCNMILMSTIYCILFLGGGLNYFEFSSATVLALKAAVIWVFFVLVRATLPRYRYDQLMDIGWKVFLPVAGSFLVFDFGVLVFFDALPVTGELPLNPTNGYDFFSKPAECLSCGI